MPLPYDRILIEVSPGESLDKIAILRLKAARMTDPAKLSRVQHELALLEAAKERLPTSPALQELFDRLADVNGRLWDIEDEIRRCEARQNFGSHFVELARSVYLTNDERSRIKRQINEELGSTLVEVKQHPKY